jgi:heme-degrading monooxygenase HmoA
MISRVWHGWTRSANADAYEALLRSTILPGIARRAIPGYVGVQLTRRDDTTEVEFVTTMWFETLEAVRAFAGEAYEVAVVPDAARALLSRFDERSIHYELVFGQGDVRPSRPR